MRRSLLLGEAGLVPILEVGAVAAAVGWMAACASYCRMKPRFPSRIAAIFGLVVTAAMILAKVVPIVPGHFSIYEWIALAFWAALGALAHAPRTRQEQATRLTKSDAVAVKLPTPNPEVFRPNAGVSPNSFSKESASFMESDLIALHSSNYRREAEVVTRALELNDIPGAVFFDDGWQARSGFAICPRGPS